MIPRVCGCRKAGPTARVPCPPIVRATKARPTARVPGPPIVRATSAMLASLSASEARTALTNAASEVVVEQSHRHLLQPQVAGPA
jgi:hypothetical protein